MADAIKIGNLEISAFKLGTTPPTIFLGGVKIYPQDTSEKDKSWTLVEDDFNDLTKFKVDYSLIANETMEYTYISNNNSYAIIYINDDIAEAYGYEDYIGQVWIVDGDCQLMDLIEDGVEYTSSNLAIPFPTRLSLNSGDAAVYTM